MVWGMMAPEYAMLCSPDAYLITPNGRVKRLIVRARVGALFRVRDADDPIRQRLPCGKRAANNQDRVFACQRTDNLRPALTVERLGDWLRAARKRVQHQQLIHTVNP